MRNSPTTRPANLDQTAKDHESRMALFDFERIAGIASEKTARSRPMSILVVDPDPLSRESLVRFAQSIGSSVETFEADSGRAAIRVVEGQEIDCVLLEYLLPDFDGLSILPMLRNAETLLPLPAIVVTDSGSEMLAVQALQSGATDYLVKSQLDASQLARSIHHSIERHRLMRALENQNNQIAQQKLELERRHQVYIEQYEGLAHALFTPLASVQEFVSLVLDGVAGPISERQGKFLAYARGECRRLRGTVESLVVSASLEKLTKARRSRVAVVPLVGAVIDEFQIEADLREIELDMAIDADVPDAEVDSYQIQQLLRELLVQALQMSHPGSRIQVVVAPDARASAELKVSVTANPELTEQFSRAILNNVEHLPNTLQAFSEGQYVVECEFEDVVRFSFNIPANEIRGN